GQGLRKGLELQAGLVDAGRVRTDGRHLLRVCAEAGQERRPRRDQAARKEESRHGRRGSVPVGARRKGGAGREAGTGLLEKDARQGERAGRGQRMDDAGAQEPQCLPARPVPAVEGGARGDRAGGWSMRRLVLLMLASACATQQAASQPPPSQAAEQPPASGVPINPPVAGPQNAEEAGVAAQPAPPPAAAAPQRDSQFSPVATGQQPVAETAAAERAFKGGNYELAIQEGKRALARNERYVPAMVVLAKAYFALHKVELCASILDTASQIDDRNAEIYFMRGHLAVNRDDKPAALAAFKAATDRDPSHGAAWDDLAAQYLVAHNFEAAHEAAARAVQLGPNVVK